MTEQYDFDVALSFAGEDRDLVTAVADELRSRQLRPFFDEDQTVELWGQDLAIHLDDVYRKRSKYAVLFLSAAYARKLWTRHELRSVLARAFEQAEPYLLPVRLDDAEIEGIRPTVGYLDARRLSPQQLADAIESKVAGLPGHVLPAPERWRVPRDRQGVQLMFEQRPDGWEHLALAGLLHIGALENEPSYNDFRFDVSRPGGVLLRSDEEVFEYLSAKPNEAQLIMRSLNGVVSNPQIAQEALGPPGHPGSPDKIVYWAQTLTDAYRQLLDWTAEVRSAVAPHERHELLLAASRLMRLPIERQRAFMYSVADRLDAEHARLVAGEHVHLEFRIIWEVDPEDERRFDDALRRVHRGLRRRRWFGGG